MSTATDDAAFREEVRSWLEENLAGEWAHLKGVGGIDRKSVV